MPKYLIKLTYYAFKTAPLMKYCQHESKNNLGEKKNDLTFLPCTETSYLWG